MGLLKTHERTADAYAKRARDAWIEGRSVYFHRFAKFGGGIARAAEEIEAVEAIGWRLDQMSFVWSDSGGNHEVGIFLFRR